MTTIVANPQVRFAPRTLARIAGVSYLLMIGAAFNEGYVIPHVVSANNPTATADNIRASAGLFRAGMFGDLTTGVFWVLTAMGLYLLLRHASQLAAGAMVVLAAVGGGIQVLNQLNQYTALTIATNDTYTHALGTSGANGLALLFAGMQQNGQLIDSVFFGLWLLPLAYLVLKSSYFPRFVGVLLIVATCGYIADSFAVLGNVPFGGLFLVPAGIGELTFLVALLVKGGRLPATVTP